MGEPFGGTEMPMKSKQQNKAMHAAAEGHSNIGIPQSVGKKFVKEQHGKSVKNLPKKAGKSRR
jgi:hypothetical protein